jgi:heme exporter protein C
MKSSRSTIALYALLAVSAVAMLIELYLIFVFAPVESQMGIVQKIFYFHAPSAYAMYLAFGVSAIASAFYLGKRDDRWDAFAVAGGEVGSMFCFIMLVTGPLWGRKAWGTYWTWDPRLTTTLLASVQRWRGTHPTVITGKGGGLHPDMYPALFLGFFLFTLIAALLIWQRARLERLRQRVLSLELEASERGLLEEP